MFFYQELYFDSLMLQNKLVQCIAKQYDIKIGHYSATDIKQ